MSQRGCSCGSGHQHQHQQSSQQHCTCQQQPPPCSCSGQSQQAVSYHPPHGCQPYQHQPSGYYPGYGWNVQVSVNVAMPPYGGGSCSCCCSCKKRPESPRTPSPPPCPFSRECIDAVLGEVRTFDGSNNNRQNRDWGQAGRALRRLVRPADLPSPDYFGGQHRRGTRDISNMMVQVSQDQNPGTERGVTDFFTFWGQFVDHNLDLTPVQDVADSKFFIPLPANEPEFERAIPFTRSQFDIEGGERVYPNALSSFLDGSAVYGSDERRANLLRDGAKLKVGPGNLLPKNTFGLENDTNKNPNAEQFFVAGDVRVNEQVGLIALHTVFVREHNRIVDLLADCRDLTEEDRYQFARAIVVAEIQKITYEEWLPILLGDGALRPYRGYREDVNPTISIEFSTAAFRFGHSMVPSRLLVGRESIPLRDLFFRPAFVDERGIDDILMGMATQEAQRLDRHVVEDLRTFLFGDPRAGGLDLAAINIQRGRDHGLANYNAVRQWCGLPCLTSWDDVSRTDTDIGEELEDTYGNKQFDNADLWMVGLCEDRAHGGLVGRTFHCILVDQFSRMRDGDRFFYENLPDCIQQHIQGRRLADIIADNTTIPRARLQDNLFSTPRRV